jgi:hypothetical protein
MNDSSVSAKPVMFVAGQRGEEVRLGFGDKLDFSGPPHVALEMTAPEDKLSVPAAPRYVTELMQVPLTEEMPNTSSDGAEIVGVGLCLPITLLAGGQLPSTWRRKQRRRSSSGSGS